MASIQASWRQVIDASDIRRSSQTISLASQDLLIFGGEIEPRQPVDNKHYRVALTGGDKEEVSILEPPSAPSPRVGSASTTVNGKTYLFSGRGGEAMAPIDEKGALQVLDSGNDGKAEWSTLAPANLEAPFPHARSYHAMASDNNDTLYVHAGCPEKGRLADLWAFNIAERQWIQLSDAPGPARGGASIAYLNGRLYRMNGFDGQSEQGFALDIYDVQKNQWSSKTWDGVGGPSPRSVSTLLAVQIGGRDMLVTMFGECDPSSLGHQGAGRMLDDVWAYDVVDEIWRRVDVVGKKPQARGWFAADLLPSKKEVVVHGGLAEDNTRLGDVWTLAF
ncbi:hypothetical protein LTR37_013019 [Vermiconidia calcicola]|uniref:Uncharacterized protein n=1 Tax=Vermiconidia calcicola TaxID=1690605 RepID=A0ACC3MZ58_9PEZI|nr:hypothetical protein LTR37_013019 [Vermiconidia calcicola]